MPTDEAWIEDDDRAATEVAAARESANFGNWIESRLHLHLTQLADDAFGFGYVTRDERITLSRAVGQALDAFRDIIETDAPQLYQRSPYAYADDDMDEAATREALTIRPVREGVVQPDGSFLAKLVGPGWGSSGYYSPAVLERDGPAVFPAGTLMLWNHPTLAEEQERPEGDLRLLAARTLEAATYDPNGPEGPGLYARAFAYADYRSQIDEKGPDTGLSIRCSGVMQPGEAEGRKGNVITALRPAQRHLTSVDFVTVPGARGTVVAVQESARTPQEEPMAEGFDQQLERDALRSLQESVRRLESENAANRRRLAEADGRARIRRAIDQEGDALPGIARARLAESVSPVLTEAGDLDTAATDARIAQAIERETLYLQQVGAGSALPDLGASRRQSLTPDQAQQRLAESFQRLGLSAHAAKLAAEG